MWVRALDRALANAVTQGRLHVRFPDGTTASYGPGPGPEADITLTDPDLPRRILLNPQLALGEAYMDGRLTIAKDDVRSLLILLVLCIKAGRLPLPMRLANRFRVATKRVMQTNTLARARRRVAHHYDIPDALYALFLDDALQYTCAYFADPAASLEAAQEAKMDLIAAKLCLRPGDRVLDIGCGWGGLALRLARLHGVHVTGITLSKAQLSVAQRKADELGLSDRVVFRLQDYRHVPDRFDRVVSVGMLEHVGVPHYHTYFNKIRDSLHADGVALIQFIGRASPPGVLSPWFQKYIFPGGYSPSLSEVAPAVERSGLTVCDLEVWRGHYERTLLHWQDRFEANQPKLRAMVDDRFIRMWRWYLVASEVSFSHLQHVLFQMQISPDPATVPATRDYLCRSLSGAVGSGWPSVQGNEDARDPS